MGAKTISIRNHWVSEGNVFPPESNAKRYSLHFSSAGEYLNYCETVKPNTGAGRASINGDREFCGTSSYKESVKLAKHGDESLSRRVLDKAKTLQISSETQSSLMASELLPAGALPDIASYLSGSPCYMETPDSLDAKPIIRIAFPYGYLCSVRTSTAELYGSALLNLVDQIEASGVATTEIVMYLGIEGSGLQFIMTFPVKKAGQHLNLDDLAFHVANSGSFRRLGFRVFESTPNIEKGNNLTSSGYGHSLAPDDVSEFDDFFEDFDLVVPTVKGNPRYEDIYKRLISSCLDQPSIKSLIAIGE